MKNNPTTKKSKQVEPKSYEPVIIEGSIDYKITISDEGYQLESKPSIQNDLAAILLAKSITEKFQVDMRMAKGSNIIKAADKKFYQGRLDKLVHSAYSLTNIATDIMLTILNRTQREEKEV